MRSVYTHPGDAMDTWRFEQIAYFLDPSRPAAPCAPGATVARKQQHCSYSHFSLRVLNSMSSLAIELAWSANSCIA